jgi:hypothetical protein
VAAVAVAVASSIGTLLIFVERTMSVVKKVSDVLLEGATYFQLKDHSSKVGYQQEVGTPEFCWCPEHAQVTHRWAF